MAGPSPISANNKPSAPIEMGANLRPRAGADE